MDEQIMLAAVKTDLGITTKVYDERLISKLRAARARIEQEGAALDLSDESDRELVVMYTAWTWRDRGTENDMPRMLRWALNNRIFGRKAAGG